MNRILFSSGADGWATPASLYAALDREFHFNLDPCPLNGNIDGKSTLFMNWRDKRVFANPPYGPGIDRWLQRSFEAELAVFLLPARTDTKWFHGIVLPHAAEVRFLKGRLRFGDATTGAPFPSMIVVFRKGHGENKDSQIAMFYEPATAVMKAERDMEYPD